MRGSDLNDTGITLEGVVSFSFVVAAVLLLLVTGMGMGMGMAAALVPDDLVVVDDNAFFLSPGTFGSFVSVFFFLHPKP